MTVKEFIEKHEFQVLSLPDPDREIKGCYIGDLLSWVMGRAEADNVWITIMSNINIAAVAAALAHFTDMGKGIIDLLPSIRDAIKVSVSEKMQLFGCCGKAGGLAVPDEAMIRRIVEEVLRNRRA